MRFKIREKNFKNLAIVTKFTSKYFLREADKITQIDAVENIYD